MVYSWAYECSYKLNGQPIHERVMASPRNKLSFALLDSDEDSYFEDLFLLSKLGKFWEKHAIQAEIRGRHGWFWFEKCDIPGLVWAVKFEGFRTVLSQYFFTLLFFLVFSSGFDSSLLRQLSFSISVLYAYLLTLPCVCIKESLHQTTCSCMLP